MRKLPARISRSWTAAVKAGVEHSLMEDASAFSSLKSLSPFAHDHRSRAFKSCWPATLARSWSWTRRKLLGIFSERDLLTKVAGIHQSFSDLPVQQFMTQSGNGQRQGHPRLCPAQDVGGYATCRWSLKGKPAGVISVRDMVRISLSFAEKGN